MPDDDYPPAPEPTPAEREPLVLDPYDSDLADLLALVRAVRSNNYTAMAFLLTSGSPGCMLVSAAKLLAELWEDAVTLDPREIAERAQAEAEQRDLASCPDIAEQVRRFDAQFSAYAAEAVARSRPPMTPA